MSKILISIPALLLVTCASLPSGNLGGGSIPRDYIPQPYPAATPSPMPDVH